LNAKRLSIGHYFKLQNFYAAPTGADCSIGDRALRIALAFMLGSFQSNVERFSIGGRAATDKARGRNNYDATGMSMP
jgi:hypothetical protein